MTVPLLEVSGVSFSYGSLPVLFDVSLAVPEGGRVCLLGTNGAGKSTLLRVVAGLARPTAGSVVFAGDDVTALPAERRFERGLALVEGGRSTCASLTVHENLRLGAFPFLADAARACAGVERALATFPQLSSRLDQPAGTLSGGEQQMLALGRALVSAPRLLMIDELALGLAPVVMEVVLQAVEEMTAAGITLLLVEQSLNVALGAGGRGVVHGEGGDPLRRAHRRARGPGRPRAVGVLRLGPGVDVIAFEVPAEVVVLGLVTGLTYGILAAGLVLVHRTTRVLNVAHGEMGALPAVVVPILVRNHGWNYWLATAMALLLAVVLGAAMELGIMRRLANAPRLLALVATIGVAQLLAAVATLLPKDSGRNQFSLGYPVPFDLHVTIGSLRLNTGELLIVVVVPLLALALGAFFRYTRSGLASRAIADNAAVAQLNGVPVRRVMLTIWILASVFAAVSAMLISPTRPIGGDALGPALLLRALGAAMVGRLTSIPVAFGAGVALGVVELVLLWNSSASGLTDVVVLVVIVVALVAGRARGRGPVVARRRRGRWRGRRPWRGSRRCDRRRRRRGACTSPWSVARWRSPWWRRTW